MAWRFEPEVVEVESCGRTYFNPAARINTYVIVASGNYGQSTGQVCNRAKEFAEQLNEILDTGLLPKYGGIW